MPASPTPPFTSGPSARVPDFIAGRNAFKGPGIHNVDARVSRLFPIFGDRYHFEIAAEAFNVANHRNILSVSTAKVAYNRSWRNLHPPSPAAQPLSAPLPLPATFGCLGALSASSAQFMAPTSTSGTIYGERQVQLLGRFIF